MPDSFIQHCCDTCSAQPNSHTVGACSCLFPLETDLFPLWDGVRAGKNPFFPPWAIGIAPSLCLHLSHHELTSMSLISALSIFLPQLHPGTGIPCQPWKKHPTSPTSPLGMCLESQDEEELLRGEVDLLTPEGLGGSMAAPHPTLPLEHCWKCPGAEFLSLPCTNPWLCDIPTAPLKKQSPYFPSKNSRHLRSVFPIKNHSTFRSWNFSIFIYFFFSVKLILVGQLGKDRTLNQSTTDGKHFRYSKSKIFNNKGNFVLLCLNPGSSPHADTT